MHSENILLITKKKNNNNNNRKQGDGKPIQEKNA